LIVRRSKFCHPQRPAPGELHVDARPQLQQGREVSRCTIRAARALVPHAGNRIEI
jgi:hypothetical protein